MQVALEAVNNYKKSVRDSDKPIKVDENQILIIEENIKLWKI